MKLQFGWMFAVWRGYNYKMIRLNGVNQSFCNDPFFIC